MRKRQLFNNNIYIYNKKNFKKKAVGGMAGSVERAPPSGFTNFKRRTAGRVKKEEREEKEGQKVDDGCDYYIPCGREKTERRVN